MVTGASTTCQSNYYLRCNSQDGQPLHSSETGWSADHGWLQGHSTTASWGESEPLYCRRAECAAPYLRHGFTRRIFGEETVDKRSDAEYSEEDEEEDQGAPQQHGTMA